MVHNRAPMAPPSTAIVLTADYERYKAALASEPLPCAFVDLDALERNVDAIVERVRARGKTIRIASKSVRSVELLQHIMHRGGDTMRGVLAYTAREARMLVRRGLRDVLVAYPTAQRSDLDAIAEANAEGARVMLAVDEAEHVRRAAEAAERAGARIPLVVDVDVSYRALGGKVHLGVRRSPLATASAVADLASLVAASPHLELAGVLAYEAHLAGVPDTSAALPILDPVRRAMKRAAGPAVRRVRAEIRAAISDRGLSVGLFNGGGTGSAAWSAEDPSLTEVSAGSGFLDSHLFDGYDGLALAPAAFFALQITRRPAPGYVTCQGGGFVASGAAGRDRLPIPWLPAGLALTPLEGAGEVQTPVVVPPGTRLDIGDPIFFRHAKAGELAEHFRSYALVRGGRIEARAVTYRGAGECF